jgi:endonuclease/exonuclease/phosphatase family metal-dependent hydrolase
MARLTGGMKRVHAGGPTPGLNEFQRSLDLDRVYRKEPATWTPRNAVGTRFRVLSWNIERGYDPSSLVDTIQALHPDIACLQEVDWGNERTGSRDVLQALADRTGMLGLFGIEFLEMASPERSRRLAGGGATGNALLCRVEPGASFRIELTTPFDWGRDVDNRALPARVRGQLRRESRMGRRFGLAAEFAAGGRRLIVCSVHFEDKFGGVSGRFRQFQSAAKAIAAHAGSAAATAIIAGDFNTFDSRLARLRTGDTRATALGRPGGISEAEWWKRVLLPPTGFSDPFDSGAWTFRVPLLFRGKLDWIAIRNGAARGHGIGPFSSSDHRPVWADIEITG